MKKELHIETTAVHAGEHRESHQGAVVTPVYQTAMFLYAGEKTYGDIRYIRLGNSPNHIALHEKLAALEKAEDALVTSSGMAAISPTLLTVLDKGGHLLAQNCLYGGTHTFLTQDFASFGLSSTFINPQNPQSWEKHLTPKTRAIYVEAMTNPTLEVADLEATTLFAKKQGLVSIIDSTFASPVNFNPTDLGFDLILHSATKYLNGHSDIVAGCVVGSKEWVEKIKHRFHHLGGSLDPHAAFLLNRGMKTLALRVRVQNENALKLAEFLGSHPTVAKVNYPGLESHEQHARAKKLFRGFGGMLSFELQGSLEYTDLFMQELTLPLIAPSLGGVETLITRPATTSHAGMTPNEREALGVTDKLVRVSVGIESIDDLIDDFKQALAKIT